MGYLDTMEPVDAGFLSVVPPLIALVMAFITKEVITSILSGVFAGTIIYTIIKRLPWFNTISIVISLLVEKVSEEMEMVIFITLLGGLIIILKNSGGSRAYGLWAMKHVKSKIGTELSTVLMSVLFFVDDYFNCLTTSTVMKPLALSNHISMEKLSFIIHSIANNICLLVPFSSWAAAIASNIKDADIEGGISVFIRCIPYNFYPILILLFVILLIAFNVDYGTMRSYEEYAAIVPDLQYSYSVRSIKRDDEEEGKEGSVWDLIIPIFLLIGFTFLYMLCTGGYFSNPSITLIQAFMDGEAVLSLSMSTISTLLCCILLLVPRKQMSFFAIIEDIKEGAKYMAPTIIILAVAWTMSGVTNELLGTGEYLGKLINDFHIPVALLPTVFFILVAITAFALGNAWCCFGIFIPIAAKICMTSAPDSLIPTLAAVMGGSVFGDQASLLSETTILLVSTMECTIHSHFKTQLPYLITVFVVSLLSYLICGFTKNNLLYSWLAGVSFLVLFIIILYYTYPHLKTSKDDMYMDNEDESKKELLSNDDDNIDIVCNKRFSDNQLLIWDVCYKVTTSEYQSDICTCKITVDF